MSRLLAACAFGEGVLLGIGSVAFILGNALAIMVVVVVPILGATIVVLDK